MIYILCNFLIYCFRVSLLSVLLDHKPILITPIISKVFEKLISCRLYKFVDFIEVLPNTQLDFRKGFENTDTLMLQSSLDKRSKSQIVLLDFISAFDGNFSQFKPVVSGVPQDNVFVHYFSFYILLISGMMLETKLLCMQMTQLYMLKFLSPSDLINNANSLNRDLFKIKFWCSTCGIKLNPGKTQSFTISRSRTFFPPHPSSTL